MLIGNLTRDPELRYTPNGTAVCSFGLATNRGWTTESGEKKEEAEFHKIVSWNKLAELCSQLLTKGRKVFVEGRLQTRTWQAPDGAQRSSTEIVIEDMIILDSRYQAGAAGNAAGVTSTSPQAVPGGSAFGVDKSTTVTALADDKTAPATTEPVVAKVTKASKAKSADEPAVNSAADTSRTKPAPVPDSGAAKEEVSPDDIPF